MAAETDVCVIGSGPAGAMAAHALVARGRTVTVVERGPYVAPEDEPPGRAWTRWDGLADVGGRVRPLMPALVGGAAEINAEVAHRMLPEDFELVARGRAVRGAAVADWPWSYAELEPYYARAEELAGVAGADDGLKHAPPRSRPYPHGPMRSECEATRRFDDACRRLGLHAAPTPVAILPEPEGERGACTRCGRCAGFRCRVGAKGTPTTTTLAAAVATGRCTVVPGVTAHRLVLEGQNAVAAELSDARGRRARLEARTFVVAAGALFTPALLARSRSPRYPNGLGDHAGLLGRFLCAHPCPRTVGVFPAPVTPLETHFAVRTIDDLYFPEPPLWKGGLMQLHLFAAATGAERATLYYCADAVPQAENRVLLSRLLDRFGVPLPRVEHRFHPLDLVSARFGAQVATRILRTMGARDVVADAQWRDNLGGGFHYSGTCRAGKEPSTSVVDADGRVHGCRNVFVADSSIFPTSGGVNPMLTVMACALRVADRVGDT
jgi:paromamine 6'-oxidase/6'''-hydroxyneomycin C oxidase/2'-deamino-2'-hydroxyparomamine 6'-oxidase